LLQLYLHDFSDFAMDSDATWDVSDDGFFQYKYFDSYWIDSSREPLLFRMDDQIVGFAPLNEWSASGRGIGCGMGDFFIMRKYRGMGLGKRAALEIIRDRPVNWEIAVRDYNKPALSFWRSVVMSIDEFTVEEIAGDNKRWTGPIWHASEVSSAVHGLFYAGMKGCNVHREVQGNPRRTARTAQDYRC